MIVLQLKGRGWGHIAFGADPVGIRVAACLHSTCISWTNKWILTKLAKTHYWEGGKELIRFWWPWPHFQGPTSTLKFSNFDPKKLVCILSLEPNDRWNLQTSFIVTLGSIKDLIRFWWSWLNFQGHHTIKTVQFSNFDHKSLSASITNDGLHSISWTNWWILKKHAQKTIETWERNH